MLTRVRVLYLHLMIYSINKKKNIFTDLMYLDNINNMLANLLELAT